VSVAGATRATVPASWSPRRSANEQAKPKRHRPSLGADRRARHGHARRLAPERVRGDGTPLHPNARAPATGEGPLTLGDLAHALGSDAPAATVAINDLERRGLVARREHPEDRRAKLVSLTIAGRATLRSAQKVADDAPEALASLPEEDVATLLRIFEKAGRARSRA
jgi:DNA-binding MarR family transcriptional regulator